MKGEILPPGTEGDAGSHPAAASKPRVRRGFRRGAYLLPSLFTTGNILLGFYAIILGLRGDFQTAALMVFAAGVLDSLDGRIARLTHTESEFGKEYDSLADVLTFGLTPALLAHLWGLSDFGRFGWLVPVYYLLACATRLARFNVQTRVVDSRFFVGLPSPAAAGCIASFLFFVPDREWRVWAEGAMFLNLIFAGTLMVSTFRYPSSKRIDLRRRFSYRMALVMAAAVLLAISHVQAFFLTLAVVYTSLGPLGWLMGKFRRSEGESRTALETEEA